MTRPTTMCISLLTRPFRARFLLAIVCVAATTVVLVAVRPYLGPALVPLLYLLPVGLSAGLWGPTAGIVAAFTAFMAFNYFFIEPIFTFSVHQTSDLTVLLIFFAVAIVISLGMAQSGLAAAKGREREATRLYELSTALAGLHDEDEVAQIVARLAFQEFQSEAVEVRVEAVEGEKAVVARRPETWIDPGRPPQAVGDLRTARRMWGAIRVWRGTAPFPPAEERLLRTFASQGALALERANLAASETRAKVLEESDRLKSALLSSVSHELRSPLATIKASASSLRSGAVRWDSEARQDLLAAIDEEADHLNRLVGNLLDMSRIESGALRPEAKWNSVAEIIDGALAGVRRSSQEHRFEIRLPKDLPLIEVDYFLMEQVFSNLLSNCVKYAPPGSTVHVGAEVPSAAIIEVEVWNEGPPVPEEHLGRIFDKFYRVTDADRVTGTGLGLSICKGIVEAHGGRIWAQNRPDGFAFHVRLPLSASGKTPPAPPEDLDLA
jgi:two-component system sensor histidine kinase KdpD